MGCSSNGGSQAAIFRVPHFLVAPTRDELVQLMMMNNLKHGIEFRYFDIQKDGRNWVAWFNFNDESIKTELLTKAVIEGDS